MGDLSRTLLGALVALAVAGLTPACIQLAPLEAAACGAEHPCLEEHDYCTNGGRCTTWQANPYLSCKSSQVCPQGAHCDGVRCKQCLDDSHCSHAHIKTLF